MSLSFKDPDRATRNLAIAWYRSQSVEAVVERGRSGHEIVIHCPCETVSRLLLGYRGEWKCSGCQNTHLAITEIRGR